MKNLKPYMIVGFVFVSVIGTLFHFVYQWSENNLILGLIAPVNESIWEHTKLIFFPMSVYALVLYRKIGGEYPCLRSSMCFGSLLGMLIIIVLYYTYTGILGFNTDVINIAIFFLSVITSFYVAYKFTLSCQVKQYENILQILNLLVICLFVIFTFSPPNIPLFVSP